MILSNTPLPTVFEISDIAFPDEFNRSYLDSLDFHNLFKNSNSLREICYDTEQHKHLYSPIIDELGEKFKEKLIELRDSDFKLWWPGDMFECLDLNFDSEIVSTTLLKDSPKFDMGLHVDNGLCIATSVINILDQNSHTIYYKDISGNEVLYAGPSSRGTGIIHLNHPGLWHTGINNDYLDRYTIKVYYGINHLVCG